MSRSKVAQTTSVPPRVPPRPAIPSAVATLPIDQLCSAPRRHRYLSVETDLTNLADSLRQHGLLHPVCVRPLGNERYEIIAGERRWRAAQLAGMTSLSCQICDVTEEQAFILGLVENIHQCHITPLEEAQAYQEMVTRGLVRNRAELARLVGVTRPRITQRMKLLELDPVTQNKLLTHPTVLTESHGRLLLEVTDLAERWQLAEIVIREMWSRDDLKQEIETRRKAREAVSRQSSHGPFPRSYILNHTGISLRIDLTQANPQQQLEVLQGIVRKLQALVEQKAPQSKEEDVPTAESGASR